MRTGRSGQGGGRRNQPRDRTSALRQPRDRPQHLEHIYGKLEVRNRAEAAAIYTQERVVTDSEAWIPPARKHPAG
jgi:hypothetical protein